MKVAVFGGSFDPPHVGHVLAALYVLSTGNVDRVLAVPTFVHAFGKPLAPFEHRVAMTRLAFSQVSGVDVSDVESALETPSRTVRTLRALASAHPDWSLRLVVGTDVLGEKEKWLDWDEATRLAPLLVLGRAGASHPSGPPAVLPEVSSTAVRGLLHGRRGAAVNDGELARLVPRAVLEYVDREGLYR
jgi:nicotinate-nucleotide adenylyltransferase